MNQGQRDRHPARRASAGDESVVHVRLHWGRIIAARDLKPDVDFIQKPWTPEGLCEKVHSVLASRSSIQRIPVVDDEQGIRNWLAEILEAAGYQVFEAQDGRGARKMAKEHHCDLVLPTILLSFLGCQSGGSTQESRLR